MTFEDPSLSNLGQAPPARTHRDAGSGPALLFSIGLAATVATLTTGILNPFRQAAMPSMTVETRLDPNLAAAWELDRIPGVGLAVARRIVEARNPLGTHVAAARYLAPRDLLNVNGVGPAMVEALTPYLRFPAYRPAPR